MVCVLIISSLFAGCGNKKDAKQTSNTTNIATTSEQKKEDIKVTATNLDEKRKEQLIKITNDYAKYAFTRDYTKFTMNDYKKSLEMYSKALVDVCNQTNRGEKTLEKEKECQDITELKNVQITEIKNLDQKFIEVDYVATVYIKQDGTLKDTTKKVKCRLAINSDNKIDAFSNGDYE